MLRRDWTLLAIAAAAGAELTPVQLQKALFLLGQELPEVPATAGEGYYQFVAYDYGPFDANVYRDAEQLEAEGFVKIEYPPDRRYRVYRVTDAGRAAADATAKHAPPRAVDYVKRLVTWIRGLSFNDLVRAVYEKYPGMKANSVFRY